MYVTPAGEVVGEGHPGPKEKVADSMAEYRRLLTKIAEQQAGLIFNLRAHKPVFVLHGVNGARVTRYTPDNSYVTRAGVFVIEDVKSPRTIQNRAYQLVKKLLLDEYGIEITEIMANDT